MATVCYTDADVNFGTALQGHVKSLTINYAAESLDETAMGDDTRIHKGGLYDWSVEAEFHQDFTVTTGLDPNMWSNVGTVATLTATAESGETWSGDAMLESYTPASGSVGDILAATATWISAGDLSHS